MSLKERIIAALKKSILAPLLFASASSSFAAAEFDRDFSPSEGILTPCEKSFRDEMCLNGYWQFQPVKIPNGFKFGNGTPPELEKPAPDKWESVKIKIPSPWNVNKWGGGNKTGEGTNLPYAPSSVYFPSYPDSWCDARMGWLKKEIDIPENFRGKRLFLHFDAIAGQAQVFVNSKPVGSHFDQHLGFECDITDAAKIGKNEILIGIRHSKLFDKHHPKYKMNATYPTGSNTDDLIGIWQDVFLIAKPEVFVEDVFVKPLVSKGILEIEVSVKNSSKKDFEGLVFADINEWLNGAAQDLKKSNALNLDDGKPLGKRLETVLNAPEPKWSLAKNPSLKISPQKISVKAGKTAKITLSTSPKDALKLWSLNEPNLYAALVKIKSAKENLDIKYTRFGWREFSISGFDILLNSEKIKAFGDLQHPFGPYTCSRRFIYGWYQMIKSFGGNAVRPHAQPWHKYYYDMADEMGLMVLAESGLFGSSIRPNLTVDETWIRTEEQIKRLVKRYRNNPSVLGWSVGNEMFAMSLPHLQVKNFEKFSRIKDEKQVKQEDLQDYKQYKADFAKLEEDKKLWEEKLANLAKVPQTLDPTRPFITIDGDRDLSGSLPVWSRHFGDGDISGGVLEAKKNLNAPKPMVVGEFGATYYGNPSRVYKYWGDEVFSSYAGRNKALAGDLYRAVKEVAIPHLAYFSPSEVCWFGIEHLPYGYNDFSRLPNLQDGVFPKKAYIEGKPGCQFERIPPYIFTINPAIDKSLPFMRPLAHYKALKAAIKNEPCEFAEVKMQKILNPQAFKHPQNAKPLPPAKFAEAFFVGNENSDLAKALRRRGAILNFKNDKLPFVIVDAENLTKEEAQILKKISSNTFAKNKDAVMLFMVAEKDLSESAKEFFEDKIEVVKHTGTAMDKGKSEIANCFNLFDLYFSEPQSGNFEERKIFKQIISGDILKGAKTAFVPSNIDWSLFDAPEMRKCAQTILYERLQKPQGAILFEKNLKKGRLAVSSLNYKLKSNQSNLLIKSVLRILGLATQRGEASAEKASVHDLLMDGPID